MKTLSNYVDHIADTLQIATPPMVLTTSVRSVKVVGGVTEGDHVLIQSGSSDSGSMQIQVAKALGAKVAMMIRKEEKRAFVEITGADLIINMTTEDFVERVREWTGGAGADVVVDNLGDDVLAKSIDAARPLAVIVAYGFTAGTESTFDVRNFFFGQKQLRGSMAGDLQDLEGPRPGAERKDQAAPARCAAAQMPSCARPRRRWNT